MVGADWRITYLHEGEKALIYGGCVGSGPALITQTGYRLLFSQPMRNAQKSMIWLGYWISTRVARAGMGLRARARPTTSDGAAR